MTRTPDYRAREIREVKLGDGTLRGAADDGVVRFKGVRYARAGRFEPPVDEPPLVGYHDALVDGPMCPQPPFELALMGLPDAVTALDEDCFFVTVTLPDTEPVAGTSRPVMVWIHGGSYVNGTGAGEYYDTGRIALDGDVVVVAINYRLGAFGFLHKEGTTEANLGILDQLSALRWVQRNIAAFGGDPRNVTLFGQSAGADAIAYLLAIPEADDLYSKAILQSAPLGLDADRVSIGEQVKANFVRALGEAGTDPRAASVEQVLAAQTSARLGLRGNRLTAGMPYAPVPGAGLVPSRHELAARWRARAPHIRVIVGFNRDDASPFLDAVPSIASARRSPSLRALTEPISQWLTRRIFGTPALRLASLLASAGATVFTYRFDWRPRGTSWGACHTLELPFFFGAREQWRSSPMLGGVEWNDLEHLGKKLRMSWAAFARTGSPVAESAAPSDRWPVHRAARVIGKRFTFAPRYADPAA